MLGKMAAKNRQLELLNLTMIVLSKHHAETAKGICTKNANSF
jgi:hypothetical protein